MTTAAHYKKNSRAWRRDHSSAPSTFATEKKCDEAGPSQANSCWRKRGGVLMTALEALPAVLDRIDHDLEASLDRLFALLRIQSVSTDPAFAAYCRTAAEHVAADLRSLGLEAVVRPTEGHPVVIGKTPAGKSGNGQTNSKANGKAPRVLFYGHYDVQPVDPLDLWQTPPFEPRIETLDGGRKIIVAPRRLRRQRPSHDVHRGLPRLQGGDRYASARHYDDDRRRRGVRLKEPVRLRARQRRRVQTRPGSGVRHRHVGRTDALDHHLAARSGLRRGQAHLCRPRSAFRAVRRRGAQSDPRAGRHSFGDAQAGRLRRYSRLL